jgi:acyl-CoA synthetase (NDP forming)
MATAERLKLLAATHQKPIFACWMGGDAVTEARSLLNACGVPTFTQPDAAARAFCLMAQYSSNVRGLYEMPTLVTKSPQEFHPRRVENVLREARKAERTPLTEVEAKAILSSYGFPVVETRRAEDEEEAVELILGKRVDPDFGPIILLAGGRLGRFGIEFVASPRHADGIVLSGTTTRNMEQALASTYDYPASLAGSWFQPLC